MFRSDRSRRLQFDHNLPFHQQIGEVIANQRPVFIIDGDGALLFCFQPRLSQPVPQGILIDLLQMTVPMVDMNVERNLPNPIA